MDAQELPTDNNAYFLSLSGGAFRGPVQYWVGHHLIVKCKIVFRVIVGTSVGSINGSMFAQHKFEELLAFYTAISGKSGFLRPRYFYMLFYPLVVLYRWLSKRVENSFGWKWPVIVGGLQSMEPTRKKLIANLQLSALKVPFVAGVVSSRTGTSYNLDTRKMKSEIEWVDAVLASSCMVPFMRPPQLELEAGKGKEYGWDGGYRNIFPQPPKNDVEKARAEGKKIIIHAIGCTPLERIADISNREDLDEASMVLRAVEFFEAEIYENDIMQLRKLAGPGGEVHLWLPPENTGSPMEASMAAIQKRLKLSVQMVERGPMVLIGL